MYVNSRRSKKIGIRACVDKIGYEFCKQHADTAVCSYGEENGKMKCYVGIDDKPEQPYDIESSPHHKNNSLPDRQRLICTQNSGHIDL